MLSVFLCDRRQRLFVNSPNNKTNVCIFYLLYTIKIEYVCCRWIITETTPRVLNTTQRVERNALSCSSPSPLSPTSLKMHRAIIVLPIEPNRTFYCSNGYSSDWERVLHLFSRKLVYLFAVRWLQSRLRVLSVGSEYLLRIYRVSVTEPIYTECTESV